MGFLAVMRIVRWQPRIETCWPAFGDVAWRVRTATAPPSPVTWPARTTLLADWRVGRERFPGRAEAVSAEETRRPVTPVGARPARTVMNFQSAHKRAMCPAPSRRTAGPD